MGKVKAKLTLKAAASTPAVSRPLPLKSQTPRLVMPTIPHTTSNNESDEDENDDTTSVTDTYVVDSDNDDSTKDASDNQDDDLDMCTSNFSTSGHEQHNDSDSDSADEDLPSLKKSKRKKARPLNEAIADILSSKPRAKASIPILSRTVIERKLEEEKREENARKIQARENKFDYSKEHTIPSVLDYEYERKLRKVATRGVVKLFNAVRATQLKVKVVKSKDKSVIESTDMKEKVISTARSTFMDILRRGTQPKTQSVLFANETPSQEASMVNKSQDSKHDHALDVKSESDAGSWNVLDDNFMLHAKLKDWEVEDENEMELE